MVFKKRHFNLYNFMLIPCYILSVFRENDQQIGLTDSSEPLPQLTPQEIKENEIVLQLFKHVAGRDEEVDWNELKEILDYYTKKEEADLPVKITPVEASPEGQTPVGNNLLTSLLILLCGTFCKDTPLADAVVSPTQDIALNQVICETKNKGFSKDVCRSMIAMLDSDRTGKLNFEEFKKLWLAIRVWKNVFVKFDKNKSGTLTGFELRDALSSAGYTLNNRILNVLMHRYGNKKGEIEFDDFIMCAVKLKIMIELFQQATSPNSNSAAFTMDDWIENTLYA